MGMCRKAGLSRSAPQAFCYIPFETPACYIPLVAQPSCRPQDKNLCVCRENLPLLHTALCNGVCNGVWAKVPVTSQSFWHVPITICLHTIVRTYIHKYIETWWEKRGFEPRRLLTRSSPIKTDQNLQLPSLQEPLSKLLVSPLIIFRIVPYTICYRAPCKEFRV